MYCMNAPSLGNIFQLISQCLRAEPRVNATLALRFFAAAAGTTNATAIRAHIVDTCRRKIATYRRFNSYYPGFGGFLPWFHVDAVTGLAPQPPHWVDAVPSLDNGELVWCMYALVQALHDAHETALALDYQNYLDMLTANTLMIFYQPDVHAFAAEVHIVDVRAQPSPDNYKNNDPNYFLDDPYEGELFIFWCDLFCDWSGVPATERESVWRRKRAKLVALNATLADGTAVTVQQGNWYSAHELWKLMELPYLQVPEAQRVFRNGEAVRARLMRDAGVGGMLASVVRIRVADVHCQ